MAFIRWLWIRNITCGSRSFRVSIVLHLDRKELDLVTPLNVLLLNGSRRQLDHGVGCKTSGQAPGNHIFSYFSDPVLPVQVHQVDGKAHAESVNGFTGNDPKPLSRAESIAAQQAF